MGSLRGKKKGEHSIVSIMWLGLFVLVFSIVVSLLHVVDVQRKFERIKVEENKQNIENASFLVQSHVEQVQHGLQKAVHIWTPSSNDGEIFAFLDKIATTDEYAKVTYVTSNGVLYNMRHEKREIGKEMLDMLTTEASKVLLVPREMAVSDTDKLCYIEPVQKDGKISGYMVMFQDVNSLLDQQVEQTLDEMGSIYLVSKAKEILTAKIAQDAIVDADAQDFVQALYDNCADTASYRRIRGTVEKMNITSEKNSTENKYPYMKNYLVDNAGMTQYVEMHSVEGVQDLYVVTVYPETKYTDVVNPVVFRSLLASMVTILITIGMIVYMWASSKRNQDTISALAYDDPITGGKNDNYFREVGANVIWENKSIPFLVARFDVANFRYINEAYGHLRADELLRVIIEESANYFKGKEVCARMNADQFVLVARNDKEFETKFEKMLDEVNDRAKEIGIMFPIRLKRGIYAVRTDDTDINIIIDRANAARKSLTGDEKDLKAVYSDKIVKAMYQTDKIESEMEDAMRNGEFRVYIQPKWDIIHDCIYGGEALVRWIKDDGTRVFPDEFIPVFEKNGFVERLDLYMLEQVCIKQRELIDAGKEIFPISVNQSRILLHNPEYVNSIAKVMRRYRMPNGYVELEITETVFQDERALMIRTTNQLKDLEVELAMDDFGSGYSSLNMLKDVPFDVIKIDKEFFSESITSNNSILILRKIIEMAEGLGIKVLCEGVETEEQVNLLRELGCCYVQGYFYSKPMPIAEFVEKYCDDMADGKMYYDNLYATEFAARAAREAIDASLDKSKSASMAVEMFKKNYVAKPDAPEVEEETDGKKMLSVEEQKILAEEERQARKEKKRLEELEAAKEKAIKASEAEEKASEDAPQKPEAKPQSKQGKQKKNKKA